MTSALRMSIGAQLANRPSATNGNPAVITPPRPSRSWDRTTRRWPPRYASATSASSPPITLIASSVLVVVSLVIASQAVRPSGRRFEQIVERLGERAIVVALRHRRRLQHG